MSQENVEIVRRFLDLAPTKPNLVWDIFDDEVVWDLGPLAADFPVVSRGPDAVRKFFRHWTGAFENWGYEVEELIDGRDAVAVLIRQWGQGKGSGVAVELRFWQVWIMRNRKAVRVTHPAEKTTALEAVGLSEQDAHADS